MFRRMKSLIGLALCSQLLLACGSEEAGQDSETNRNEETVQYLLPQNMSLTELEISSNEEDIHAVYADQQWTIEKAEKTDETAMAFFIEDLRELTGRRVEREHEGTEDLSIHLTDRSDDIILKIWNDEETIIQVDDRSYIADTLPASLSPFSGTFLESAIELDIASLEEVRLTGDETIVLNQTTELTEVERIPFISGWYLHGPYDTDFSVEYSWMDQFLENLTRIHGEETDMAIEEVVQTIEISGSQGSDTIDIGNAVEGTQTLIRVNSQDQNYLVPRQLTEFYQFDPLDITDNFIALIPLDAVERVDIAKGTDRFSISVDRDFSIDDDEEVIVDSTFYFNDREIEESVMRRAYQYLARLSYEREFDKESDEQDLNGEAVQLTYKFNNDGTVIEKNIELLPVSDTNAFIVENESITEFVATDEKLNDMFEAFRELEK